MTVTMPSSVASVGASAFYGCSGITEVIAYGAAPSGISSSGLAKTSVWFKREFAPSWIGAGFALHRSNYFIREDPRVNVLSSQIRANDPTVMDVEYVVTSESPTVRVRALAFKNGVRSFANVVRPETFVDGTAANIGEEVAANVPHKLSWRVSADYGIELTKMKFEVIAQEGDLLPMEWIYIPKSDQYGKMKASYNTLSEVQVYDALMWLYAAKDSGLTLSGGVLKGGGYTLANGASSSGTSAVNYVFSKMGWTALSGAVLNYVNSETRKGLSPSGVKQYAYQIVE